MFLFPDIIEIYNSLAYKINNGLIKPNEPLEKLIISIFSHNIAYLDNKKDALNKYEFDFWREIKLKDKVKTTEYLKRWNLSVGNLYSNSGQFPDFVFKTEIINDKINSGSILELKDSKSGTISSFNSTLPSKTKSLTEIDNINSSKLVSRMVIVKDKNSEKTGFFDFQRKCFYFVRTNNMNLAKIKLSFIDGSFFETIPNERLIAQTWKSILREHREKSCTNISEEQFANLDSALSFLTDHSIISSSKNIERASIKPRLRLMAEVHPEGNPHSSNYPMVKDKSFNLIIPFNEYNEIPEQHRKLLDDFEISEIEHKRNGIYKLISCNFNA